MTERQLLTARIVRSVELSERTKHLELEVENVPRFDFIAGQFVSMKSWRGDTEVTRAYSIASAPRNDARFDLCLNRIDEGFFSNWLCDQPIGAGVRFHGPHGYFTLKQPVRDSIFIAVGTGIAPIRGMIHWLLADASRADGHEFWLVFGNRTERDIYYHEEFVRLARERRNLHYIPTLSRPNGEWSGARGYVQEHVRELAAGRTDTDAYICGLKDMVQANRALLKELGWDRRAIIYERFD
jgi:ferredoxin-NADP reductase